MKPTKMRKLHSEQLSDWMEKEAEVVVYDIPFAPISYSYRAGVSYGPKFAGKARPQARVYPSPTYQEAKEQFKGWLEKNHVDKPGMVLSGIVYDHVFSIPKAATKWQRQQMMEIWGERPIPTDLAKGDVHDNLNKIIPDCLMDLGYLKDDSSLFYVHGAKFVGYSDHVTVKLYYLPEQYVGFYSNGRKRSGSV